MPFESLPAFGHISAESILRWPRFYWLAVARSLAWFSSRYLAISQYKGSTTDAKVCAVALQAVMNPGNRGH
jgi:hypothetical protein